MLIFAPGMKKLFSLFSLLLVAGYTFGQPKQDIENIPPFHILTTDSTWCTPAGLRKHKPVMIIYFSPDCGHCQRLMKEMKPKLGQFGDTQIVMITYIQPTMLKAIKVFYHDFNLVKYPNVTVGTEGYTFIVQQYYQLKKTPYIAIYNRQGKLIKAFENTPPVDELINTAKKG